MRKDTHICFLAHLAYGALAGAEGGHIGGVERQTSLMASWFAARGYRVSIVTWDEGQVDGARIDGIRVLRMCRQDAGVPGLRFFSPRWSSLVAALERADADVYYHNCGEYVTGQVALWCRRHNRKFVYSVASDPDCDVLLPEMHKIHERVLYRYGLRHADRIIVQTRKQRQMLATGFGCDSVVIPMPCPGPSDAEYADCVKRRDDTQRVLWIGRVCEVKRPDRLLDLAEACPDLHFDFVGPASGSKYAHDVCERAKNITNVSVHGAAPRERVADFYRQASVLCCTSDFEGFPNTFLEAWSHGVPVVSTVDPDNLIAEKGLGRVGQDVPELAQGIRAILAAPDQWQAASEAARKYYVDHHAMDAAMERFERVFCNVTSTPTATGNGDRT